MNKTEGEQMAKNENEQRLAELREIFAHVDAGTAAITGPIIEDIAFIEGRLRELRTLPMLQINPHNPQQQRTTPAAKQYKEMLQQYINAVKVLTMILSRYGVEEKDAFEQWLEEARGI